MAKHLNDEEQLAAHDEVLAALAADVVPEPSPLFWDHLSARVREATANEPVPARPRVSWQVWLAAIVATAAALLVIVLRVAPSPVPPPRVATVAGAGAPADASNGAEPWDAVVQVASSLSSDDLHGMVAAGDTSLLVEELSPAERAAFVRLLHAEMEKSQ